MTDSVPPPPPEENHSDQPPASPYSPPESAPAQPSGAAISQDDKTMAMLSHLLGIITGFIGPLVIWLVKKDESAFVNDQAKEALNFHITMAIAWAIVVVLCFLVIGFLIAPILGIVQLILPIIAGIKANDGVRYRYPFAIRLIN